MAKLMVLLELAVSKVRRLKMMSSMSPKAVLDQSIWRALFNQVHKCPTPHDPLQDQELICLAACLPTEAKTIARTSPEQAVQQPKWTL